MGLQMNCSIILLDMSARLRQPVYVSLGSENNSAPRARPIFLMADSFLKQVELGEGIICKKATQLYRRIYAL